MTPSELNRLVLSLWDFDDPTGSRSRFETVAAILRTQIARSHGLAGEFEAGHRVLDETPLIDGEPQVRVLLERGRLLRSGGDPAGSSPVFLQAYELAVKHGFAGLAADAAHMLALVGEDEEWTARGIAAAEGSDDPLALGMVGALLNNLGWTYADEGRWEDAYPLFDRAVTARLAVVQSGGGLAAEKSLHVARWTRARAARALGRYDAALAELRELAATEIGVADPYVAEELAANEADSGRE